MFRLGDYYECFFEDAVIVCTAVDCRLYRRSDGDYVMVSIHKSRIEETIMCLKTQGYRVALLSKEGDNVDYCG